MARHYRRTTIILWALLLFIAGLGFARSKIEIRPAWLIASFIATIISAKGPRQVFLLLILLTTFLGGWYRGAEFMHRLQVYNSLYKKPMVIEAVVDQDGNYSDKNQLAFTVSSIKMISPTPRQLTGTLSISGFGASMVYRGDTVKIEGKIYPTRGGKQGTMQFASVAVIHHQETLLDNIRHRFNAGIYSALPEPLASFALGLLVGQRTALSKNTTDILTAAGLTHIVAVSGYNLTIIIEAVKGARAKKSRYQTVVLSLGLVLLFVLLVGSSPSILRAALVCLFTIWAWYYGRSIRPVLLILLVAAMTAGFYPIYLWSDVGWYLSFLAFFGVLVIAPLLMKKLSRKQKPAIILAVLVETVSAQIMTAPIIMYIFGRASYLSVFANLMVVPFVPLAMLLSLFAGLAGVWLPIFSGYAAFPARFLLTYMLDVAGFFAHLPHVVIEKSVSLVQMLFMYAVLGTLVVVLWLKNKDKHGIVTDKKARF
jgi:competence protein ComEC